MARDTTKVTLCHFPSDCPDSAYPECCTFTSGSATLTFCTDKVTATLGGATCH